MAAARLLVALILASTAVWLIASLVVLASAGETEPAIPATTGLVIVVLAAVAGRGYYRNDNRGRTPYW